jgi:hypothetical protein
MNKKDYQRAPNNYTHSMNIFHSSESSEVPVNRKKLFEELKHYGNIPTRHNRFISSLYKIYTKLANDIIK